jgi:hypothetical protein
MKLHHLIVFSAFFCGALCSTVRAEVIDLTTVTGKTYKQCRVVKLDPDGVLFRHSNGAGKVLFKDLIKPLRDHFGFDPSKLKAHEEKVQADKAKERKIAEERARELMKQRQEAIEQALDRQALFALQQANALAQAQAAQGGNLGSFVALGGAFDGNDYVRDGNRRHAYNWYVGQLGMNPGFCYPGASYGYTPRPFFAVPGIGPNVWPSAACPPRVIHGSGTIVHR